MRAPATHNVRVERGNERQRTPKGSGPKMGPGIDPTTERDELPYDRATAKLFQQTAYSHAMPDRRSEAGEARYGGQAGPDKTATYTIPAPGSWGAARKLHMLTRKIKRSTVEKGHSADRRNGKASLGSSSGVHPR